MICFYQAIQEPPRSRRAYARKELDETKARYPVTQIFSPAQEGKDILNMRCFEELEAAVFYEWNMASR